MNKRRLLFFAVSTLILLLAASASRAQSGWTLRAGNTTSNLTSLVLQDHNNAWAAGTDGTVLHTTDGGTNWTEQATPTDSTLRDVQFFDFRHGCAVGDGEVILTTLNTGSTWVAQRSDSLGQLFKVHMFDPDSMVAVGRSASDEVLIGTTTNGWAISEWTTASIGGEGWITDCEFLTRDIWVAVVTRPDGGSTIARTEDGGNFWMVFWESDSVNATAIDFVTEQTGYFVTSSGSIYRTVNGGYEWSSLCETGPYSLTDIHFASESIGYVTGRPGVVYYTNDGGENWQEQTIEGLSLPLSRLDDSGLYHQIAVGDSGRIYTTETGGWPSSPPTWFYASSPANESHAARGPVLFSWTPSVDPDNDPVTYTFSISIPEIGLTEAYTTSDTCYTIDFSTYNLPESQVTVEWIVNATDGFHSQPMSGGARTLYLPFGFDGPGFIRGTLTDVVSGDSLSGSLALYDMSTGSLIDMAGANNGVFAFEGQDPGRYRLEVTSAGHLDLDTTNIELASQDTIRLDLRMEPYPLVPIDSLQNNPSFVDQRVRIQGVITTPVNAFSDTDTRFYVQDSSNRGVQIYHSFPLIARYGRGDEVAVEGTVEEVDGMTRLVQFNLTVVEDEAGIPVPDRFGTGELSQNAALEGSYVEVVGRLMGVPSTGSYNIDLDDGSGILTMHISEFANLDLSDTHLGDYYIVRGVVVLDSGSVQIWPGDQEDLEAIEPLTAPSNLAAELDSTNGHVSLSWEHAEASREDFIEYIVCRDSVEVARCTTLSWDEDLPGFGSYEYTVAAAYDNGDSQPSAPAAVEWLESDVSERGVHGVPQSYAIASAYPNPFNPEVNLVLAVPQSGRVSATVYDVLGRKVATVVNSRLAAGYHRFAWRPANLTAGTYFLRMQAKGFSQVRRVTFVK